MGSYGGQSDGLTSGSGNVPHRDPGVVWRTGNGDENHSCHSRTEGQIVLARDKGTGNFSSYVSKRRPRFLSLDSLKQSCSLKSHNQIFTSGRGTHLFSL